MSRCFNVSGPAPLIASFTVSSPLEVKCESRKCSSSGRRFLSAIDLKDWLLLWTFYDDEEGASKGYTMSSAEHVRKGLYSSRRELWKQGRIRSCP